MEEELKKRDGKKVEVLEKKKILVEDKDEGDRGYWGIRKEKRKRIYDIFERYNVKINERGKMKREW